MTKDCDTAGKNSSVTTPAGNPEQIELRTLPEAELKQILDAHQKRMVSKGVEGEIAELSFPIFTGQVLSDTVLNHANMQGADLSGSNLEGAHLENSNLSGSNLKTANLLGATLLLEFNYFKFIDILKFWYYQVRNQTVIA